MKNLLKKLCLGVLAFALVGCGTPSGHQDDEMLIVDMQGREVYVKKDAQTFACLGPGCLRQYCYIGDTSKLVGIENCELTSNPATKPYVNSIDNLKELPIIGKGGSSELSYYEQLAALQPDVIFTSYVSDIAKINELAKKTNCPVVAVGYNSNGLFAQDIYDSLIMMAKICGDAYRGQQVVKYFQDNKALLEKKANVKPSNEKAYLGCVNFRGSHGINFTTGDFPIFDVLHIKNLAVELGLNHFSEIDKEVLLQYPTDKIIIDAGGLKLLEEDMRQNAWFYQEINAFKNNEVYMILPTVYYSCNFDVALANAFYLGSVFYPEQFQGFDIKEKFNEITTFLLGVEVYDEMCEYFHTSYQKMDLSF